MTQDDMIKMAREAGWEYAEDDRGYEPLWKAMRLAYAAGAAAEREACAKVCEAHVTGLIPVTKAAHGYHDAMRAAAAAIRARSAK